MMIKKLLCLVVSVTILGSSIFGFTPLAHADFNHSLIMDDATFNNTASMNISQINSFLNQFPNSCISTNNGFSAPDPTGYNPSTGYTYGANVSAGQVIYDAALAYGLNPQVLLATLQKEQSLVTGSAGCYPNTPDPASATPMTNQCGSGTRNCTLACTHAGGCIPIAVGYGCPNYCDVSVEGFSKQIIHAAWLFKFGQQRSLGNTGWNVQLNNSPQAGDHWDNSDDPGTCYGGPMTQGNLSRGCSQAVTFYDGYTTIDGSSVHMDSGATAALYWYTPHFSGNQSFINIYTGWFGSTVSSGINLGRDAGSPIAIASNQDGRLETVGVADNDSLYTKTEVAASSNSWTSWSQLAGGLRNITAETNSNGTILLVGVAGNGNIYTNVQTTANSTNWSGWAQIDGGLADVALARNYDGSLEIFGVANNGAIYYRKQSSPNSVSWAAWKQLPGGLQNITADTNADGRIQLVGIAGNGGVYSTSQTATNTDTWSGWAQMDGGLRNATLARNDGNGSLEIFGTASNGAIYHRRQSSPNSASWAAWKQLPGALKSIASEYNSDGRIQLVGIAVNGGVYYTSQTAANTDVWSAWSQMDGALRKY